MSERDDDLFETLEPPQGGLARLHSRIEHDARRRVRHRRVGAAAAVVMVAALGGWLAIAPPFAPRPGSPELDTIRLGLGQRPLPSEPLTIAAEDRARMAARRVPVDNERVVLYFVASLGVADSGATRGGKPTPSLR